MVETRSVRDVRELERVFFILDRAFRRTRADYFIRRTTIGKCDYDFWQTRVLLYEGRIVSTVEIFPTEIWFEGKKVKNAGIGSVATDPDFQGRGFGQKIVEDTNEVARRKGFVVASLFTSIFDFYARSDYFKVTYPYYEIGEVGSIPTHKYVITFMPRYIDDILKIHAQYNSPLIGPVVKNRECILRSFAYLNEDAWLFLLAVGKDGITGYIRAREFKNTIEVLEFASLTPDEDLALFVPELRKRGSFYRIFINFSDSEKARINNVELLPRGNYSMMFSILDKGFIGKDEFIRKFQEKGNFWLSDLY